MNTPADRFLRLSSAAKRTVNFRLSRYALATWQEYSASTRRRSYMESVAGSTQQIDYELPADAFESASAGRDLKNVAERYGEPILAMHEDDLEFPEAIEYAYYALYHLFKRYALHQEFDETLIVRQALASQDGNPQWLQLFETALQESEYQENNAGTEDSSC